MVASASRLRAAPHAEQKRPSGGFFAPQEEQNMGGRDSITARECAANYMILNDGLRQLVAPASCRLRLFSSFDVTR
jgi:hypothetical protein